MKLNLKHANIAIGEHMAKIRKRCGYTQTEIAHAIGLDQSALSRAENGRQIITAAQLIAFYDFIGVKCDRLTARILRKIQPRRRMRRAA